MWNPERKLDLPQNTTQCHGVWLCRLEISAYRWCTLARAVSLSFLFFFLALSLFSWSSACLSRKKLELISQYAGALEYLYMPLQHTATYYSPMQHTTLQMHHNWTTPNFSHEHNSISCLFGRMWVFFSSVDRGLLYPRKCHPTLVNHGEFWKKCPMIAPGQSNSWRNNLDRNDRRYKIWQNK